MTILLLVIIYIAFISLGLPDSMLGAAWPTIRTDFNLPISGAGLITLILSGGTIVSSFFSGHLISKLGTGKITFFSVLLTASALMGFSISPNYLWLCIMAIPLGLGAGAVDSALNSYVALHFSSKQMSWLHCFWGVGASLGPLIMSYAITNTNDWHNGYFMVSLIQICLVLFLFMSLPIWKKVPESHPSEEKTYSKIKPFHLPGVKPALIGFFCYCALESTAGLWGASYLVQTKRIDHNIAAAWISIYYLGITLGRFINGFITKKLSNPILIRIGQIIIGVGICLLLFSRENVSTLLGLILIGLGCAPIYPSMLHETPVRFGKNNSSRMMGIQMGVAYTGATLIPPSIGLILGSLGLKYYPIFLSILLILMAIGTEMIYFIVQKKNKLLY